MTTGRKVIIVIYLSIIASVILLVISAVRG